MEQGFRLAGASPVHLANLASRITTAAATDAHAIRRVTSVGGLQTYYRDTLRAYADIAPGDGTTTTLTPAQPRPALTCTSGTVIPNPAATRVTGLSLPGQSLSGRIPMGLGQLFGLTTLNLKTNSMTGNIPAEPGWRC